MYKTVHKIVKARGLYTVGPRTVRIRLVCIQLVRSYFCGGKYSNSVDFRGNIRTVLIQILWIQIVRPWIQIVRTHIVWIQILLIQIVRTY